jgi:hypothetical protein
MSDHHPATSNAPNGNSITSGKADQNPMIKYGDNFIPVIPMEDDLLHTEAHPFCWNPSCGCHEDPILFTPVTQAVLDGLLTPNEAARLVNGEML